MHRSPTVCQVLDVRFRPHKNQLVRTHKVDQKLQKENEIPLAVVVASFSPEQPVLSCSAPPPPATSASLRWKSWRRSADSLRRTTCPSLLKFSSVDCSSQKIVHCSRASPTCHSPVLVCSATRSHADQNPLKPRRNPAPRRKRPRKARKAPKRPKAHVNDPQTYLKNTEAKCSHLTSDFVP